MFSFFKKKTTPAEPEQPVPAELADPAEPAALAEAVQPAASEAPAPNSAEGEKRSWLDRLRGVPAEPLRQGAQPLSSRETEVDVPPVVEPAPIVLPVEATSSSASASAPDAERRSWIEKLRGGLRKTGSSIAEVFTGTQIDDALYEELESALLMADAGVKATEYLLADLKWRVAEERAKTPQAVKALLANAIADLLKPLERGLEVGKHTPTVMMVVGVNGAGKTTSIGKLTRHLAESNQKVLLAAADTFRAAAREQLAVWAGRNRVEIVGQDGGDPAAVTFDAVVAGKARGCDVVIADTAGRLITQVHLMDELKKIRRVIGKAQAGAPHEVLLVVDGNTGQNALTQVQAFDAALTLTGLVITKLDGTAKGGVLAAIALWARERSQAGGAPPLPVYFIGVGEKLEDLQTFDAREFAQALLS